ncbi:NUDIX domain-containing protein [Kitasatospora sp. NPDC057223]|uniref:NUDIX domain-containing protein n=1 Tax=Kitasatospora sp. NPDC057223 TaxID=3346055 RepID=UPI003641ED87
MTSPTTTIAPADFAAALPPHAVSATVLVTDLSGRILMLHQARPYPGHPAWWQLPGGLGDLGEQPTHTARREVEEETGLRPTGILRPLVIDYRSAADGWPPVIDFAFDTDPVPDGQPIRLSPEHDTHAWHTYDQWLPHLQPEQRDWFASLWHAHTTRTTALLTDGLNVAGSTAAASC